MPIMSSGSPRRSPRDSPTHMLIIGKGDQQSHGHDGDDDDMISILSNEFGQSDPKVAEHLNSLGLRHYHGRSDYVSALRCHREAYEILDWNKCNALLFDREDDSRRFAVDMALTQSDIGNLLRETNDFIGAADAYRDCLNLFLEGLVENGGTIKRMLLDLEHEDRHQEQEARILESINREEIGTTLCHHPGFRSAVRGISLLLRDMQCVKFVASNAASSRRRRWMHQHISTAENLANAVASLTMSTSDLTENRSITSEEGKQVAPTKCADIGVPTYISQSGRSKSWNTVLPAVPRPRPMGRRAITSYDDYDVQKELAFAIIPAEDALNAALNRFPGVASIVYRQKSVSCPSAILQEGLPSTKECDEAMPGSEVDETSGIVVLPQEEEMVKFSPPSITKNISERFSEDFLRCSMSCGGGMASPESPLVEL